MKDPNIEVKLDVLNFLSEIFHMSKSFSVNIRVTMMSTIKNNYEKLKIFDFAVECLDMLHETAKNPTANQDKIHKAGHQAVEFITQYL